jgi:hypothetical protein
MCEKFIVEATEGAMKNAGTMGFYLELIKQAIEALGIIGSEKLLDVTPGLISAFSIISLRNDDLADYSKQILGSLAFGLFNFSRKKGTILANYLDDDFYKGLSFDNITVEEKLVIIDLFEAFFDKNTILKETCQIERWEKSSRFLSLIKRDEKIKGKLLEDEIKLKLEGNLPINTANYYLATAPGYECTLKTVLVVCKASIVLVYTKDKSKNNFKKDNKYYLTASGSLSEYTKPFHQLEPGENTIDMFGEDIMSRMEGGLFFYNDNDAMTSLLTKFTRGRDIQYNYMLGGSLNTSDDNYDYYLIIGFEGEIDNKSIPTTYYYWLRLESMVSIILASIQKIYSVSSQARSRIIQSINPFHTLTLKGNNPKRKILKIAIGDIDIGNIMKRAVGISSESLSNLRLMKKKLMKWITQIETSIKSVYEDLFKNDEIKFPEIEDIHIDIFRLTWFSCHYEVIEFISIELLINALSYSTSSIYIDISIRNNYNELSEVMADLVIVVKNMFSGTFSRNKDKFRGLAACEVAAQAFGGYLEYGCKEMKGGNVWETTLSIPIQLLPPDLQNFLDVPLKNRSRNE